MSYVPLFEEYESDFSAWRAKFDGHLDEMIAELKSGILYELGLTVRIDADYVFKGEAKNWLAVYRRSLNLISDGIIPIAINYHLMYRKMKSLGIDTDDFNIEAQARITVGHEIGHGLCDFIACRTQECLGEDYEEEVVEEFGESMFPEATGTWGSELMTMLSEIK